VKILEDGGLTGTSTSTFTINNSTA
jgi:hypothetical protein